MGIAKVAGREASAQDRLRRSLNAIIKVQSGLAQAVPRPRCAISGKSQSFQDKIMRQNKRL